VSCAILKLTPKRTLLRWQAFLALESDRIKPEIDELWEKLEATSLKKNRWLQFLCNKVTKRMVS
jgi:hypothetical protein